MDAHPDYMARPAAADGFHLRELAGGRVLVSPRKDKWTWQPGERRYRSAIVCPRAGIVSQGFPKFDNLDQNEDDTAALHAALAAGEEVWFTEKLDGSLCIRSVIDGQVVLRTRGTHDGGSDHGPAMRRLAARRYPALLDPELWPSGSLLFEFVSPDFPIVIHYAEEDLVLIGAVAHADGRLADRPGLEALAAVGGVPLVATHTLPADPAELVAAVGAYSEAEGVVARCAAGQVLVKIKSAAYLAAHALRFAFTPRRIAEFCVAREITDEDAFIDALRQEGMDWEVGEEARGPFRAYRAAVAEADARFAELAGLAEQWRDLPRREFAGLAKRHGREAHILFMCLDRRTDQARAALRSEHVDRALRALSDQDAVPAAAAG